MDSLPFASPSTPAPEALGSIEGKIWTLLTEGITQPLPSDPSPFYSVRREVPSLGSDGDNLASMLGKPEVPAFHFPGSLDSLTCTFVSCLIKSL